MPGPGRGGRGGFRPGGGGFRGHRGPGPALFRGPLGVIGAVATGAAVAAVVSRPPPPRRRYGPPPSGYIYVVPAGAVAGAAPRAVRAEEGSFIVRRIGIASYEQGTEGEVLFGVHVTMNDGYSYTVRRRYSQFDQLRERVARFLRHVTPPFPPKHGVRSATMGLPANIIEERRSMLQAWLQSLCTAATSTPALRLPLYDFLETATYYPPEVTAVGTTEEAVASPPVPYATATPYASSVTPPHPPAVAPLAKPDPASDGWSVPVESREASDVKLAMAGPDSYGRLPASKAAEALREGTGATSDDLRAVWELSDIDKDGMLDREEFAVAWYLSHQAAAGNKPPSVLPPEFVPLSKRTEAPRSSANPF